jgi:hypothetical protein
MVTLGVFLKVFETQDPGIHDTLTHDLLYNRKSLLILLRKLSTWFYSKLSLNCITTIDNLYINAILHARIIQARSSLYANTQLRAHRRAEEKKIKSKTNKINKE